MGGTVAAILAGDDRDALAAVIGLLLIILLAPTRSGAGNKHLPDKVESI
ncbi:MAG: hypothetical protein SV966_16195 [Actinomycetota bacterium]|nr:hypothetical protein [Actinomycetota bacterium]